MAAPEDAPLEVLALAHLGAGIQLLSRCDPAMAEALTAVLEGSAR